MDLAALPGFPTNLKPILPGHPRHKSHRNGKSASARKRRKRARAKYAAAIVRKHGGAVTAVSPGEGAELTVLLPATESAAPA